MEREMMKKKKFSYKDILYKSKRLSALCLICAFCVGIAVTAKMGEEVPMHDGDILVDSLAVSEESGGSKENISKEGDSAFEENGSSSGLARETDVAGKGEGESVVKDGRVGDGDAAALSDFGDIRAKLELDRNKLLSSLDNTLKNSSNEAEKNNAAREKERILDCTKKELLCESQIVSKNLPQCLVILSQNDIRVTVDKQELDTNTVAKICDIVMRETGESADKIVIQSRY